MQDCRLVLEVKGGKVSVIAEKMDMVGLATMCGILEQFMGAEALRRGKSLEDVKDSMLDIHLAAMDSLTGQIIRERGENHGFQQETADPEGKKVQCPI
ncbi:MAG: hypothetical protein NC307_11405 [Roseburia sp.]|nr:hypothetical protein [Roseburia sp.]